MRSRYDLPPDDESLDEPVTLTGRQLRSLKWGSRLGGFALVLALAAAGLAGWTWYQGQNQDSGMIASINTGAEQTPPAGGAQVAPATDQVASAAPSAPSPATSTPAVQPVTPAPTAKPAAATVRATKSASAPARGGKLVLPAAPAKKPVTESFEPSPAVPVTATPSPVPAAAEPQKPAAKDTSAAHH